MAIPLRVAIRKNPVDHDTHYLIPGWEEINRIAKRKPSKGEVILRTKRNVLIYDPQRIFISANPRSRLIYEAFHEDNYPIKTFEINKFSEANELASDIQAKLKVYPDEICPIAIPLSIEREESLSSFINFLHKEYKARPYSAPENHPIH